MDWHSVRVAALITAGIACVVVLLASMRRD
jgi:hypothetical protein